MNLKVFLKNKIKKAAGIQNLQEEIDTLYYFLNQYHDITGFPQAVGGLRDVQICDTVLLEIVDAICRKYKLRYWISCGNLIGAVRHKGFIPWDDDTDIYMCRSDYDRAKEIFENELVQYGLSIEEPKIMGWLGLGYKTDNTGVWLDIFPVDFLNLSELAGENIEKIRKNIDAYYRQYIKMKKYSSREQIFEKKQSMIPFLCKEEEATHCFRATEFDLAYVIQSASTLFPLKPIKYEYTELMAPNNPEQYLKEWLQGDYMEFPRGGVLHHGKDGVPLYEWASRSGTDMAEIKLYLEEIFNKISITN